ncbi:MAG TPA: TetR/AcrR family transcriptional regulator [Ktedonobacterales bacterium]|nr:TetR/AcrR family transcriptional regulator [Ktedonobacterales bacterium]
MEDEPQITVQDHSKPYHHGDLWRALVQAGIEILHEEGVHALTLRAVARRAGVSHAAPYRHFADKDELLSAIAEDGYQRLIAGLEDVLSHDYDDAGTLLQVAGRRYVHFILDNPDHVRVMFSGLLGDYEKYPGLENAANQAFALLMEMIARCQRIGGLIPGDPAQQGLAAWSMVHGLASLLMENCFPPSMQDHIDVDQMTDFCVAIFCRGLQI